MTNMMTPRFLSHTDCVTSFTLGSAMQGKIASKKLAHVANAQFFMMVILPRLIVVDADLVFAGAFDGLFQLLGIPAVCPASRDNHQAICNEQFLHQHSKEVQQINAMDAGTFLQWVQGALFTICTWNASPIDAEDVSQAWVAIGRDFPFPIDLSPEMPRESSSDPQHALDYYDVASPLLFWQ